MISKKNLSSFIQKFIPCLILCFGGGFLTGLLTQHGVKEWYPHLIKPYGTPADIVFPIVWSILYLFMAIALTLLWVSETTGKRAAFLFFTVQLFFNFIWSSVFFYLQEPGFALIDIVLLWISILLTIRFFWPHTQIGTYLLIPYLIWVSYAFYLNLFIWIYN